MKEEKLIEIIDTKITDKWGVYWDEMETVRDFLQNFYDANDIKDIKVKTKDKTVTVFAPIAFDYQELIYLGSDKDQNPDLIGQYGEGWKASVLNALRNYNCSVEIIVDDKRLLFYFEDKKIGKTYKRVVFCKVTECKPVNGSMLTIGNCSQKIIEEFQFGFRYFYYEKNPLFGKLLNSSWEKPIEFYTSTDGNGYIFYKKLLRARLDIPIVIICNKAYHHVDVKIKHDRDRKAFNEEVLQRLLKYVCKRVSNCEKIVFHLKDFWENGHKVLSIFASTRGWRGQKIKFPETYYAKKKEEKRYDRIEKKDFNLLLEIDAVTETFRKNGYIECPSYMANLGMKTAREIAEENLKNKLSKQLTTKSRDISFNEKTAINLLVEIVKYFSRDLFIKVNNFEYTIAENEDTAKNLKSNKERGEKRIFINKSFFTFEFIDALILMLKEWDSYLSEGSLFSGLYISIISSLVKKEETIPLFKKFSENWDKLIEKLLEGEDLIPISATYQVNKSKHINRIRVLFTEGDINTVIEEIEKFEIEKEELKNDFTLLSEQYKTWRRGYLQGIEDVNSPTINRVKSGILRVINKLNNI